MATKSTLSVANKILILGVLYDEEAYGFGIIEEIEKISDEAIVIKEGTLYPILKTLKSKQLVRSQWRKSPAGKSRKYYTITERGKAEYKRLIIEWNQLNHIISNQRQ